LLKISLIYNDDDHPPTIEPYNGNRKAPVKRSDFRREAEIQKTTYIQNDNICPDVIGYDFFSLEDKWSILDIIQTKFILKRNHVTAKRIIDYLQSSNLEIGIMVQEFLEGDPIPDHPDENDIIRIGVLLLLLLIDCKLIHMDLHFNNVLCTNLRCMLIDFGDVANVVNVKFPIPYTLKNDFTSKYINANTIDGVFDVNQIYNNILTNIVVDTDAKKTEFVYQMFTLIGYVSLLQVNNKKYQKREELIIQLVNLIETLKSKKKEQAIQDKKTAIFLKDDIRQIETDIEAIKEDIEEYKLHYTNPNITFSKYPFRDMYELLKTKITLFPRIYDIFIANRQTRQEHIGGYKKEKRKKTVTKQNNKKKIQHTKTKKRQVK